MIPLRFAFGHVRRHGERYVEEYGIVVADPPPFPPRMRLWRWWRHR